VAVPVCYCAALQFPELRQAATSEHVVGKPSIEHPQPNCEHHPCWLRAIDLYMSESAVTLVPVDAQPAKVAHSMTARTLEIRFMIRHLSVVQDLAPRDDADCSFRGGWTRSASSRDSKASGTIGAMRRKIHPKKVAVSFKT